ncbi:MAG TPA: ADP-ribosylglycohydrolase family protein [Myxococcaceae bacterium]|nr:ADP-ribosylglycohydrolase family protein [Myxococcaceae bacterium]
MPTRKERLEGGLVGLLVGDALGVPYEFHAAPDIPPPEQLDFDPPPGFRRAHRGVPPGTWSDDGAQALCLLASLLEHGALNPDDFATKLLAWEQDGYLAVDGQVFDMGIQTQRALGALRRGIPALEAGPSGERENGNGSLMRVLPLALWHQGTDAELVRDAQLQSRVTHGHPRSQLCCALYCLWARRTLEGVPEAWREAVAAMRALHPEGTPERRELEDGVRAGAPPGGKGSGYVVDCLHSARAAVEAGSYEAVVKAAVRLGDDTDTTAAVAGGIVGVRDGIGAIPEKWRRGLRGQELLQPLLDALLARG